MNFSALSILLLIAQLTVASPKFSGQSLKKLARQNSDSVLNLLQKGHFLHLPPKEFNYLLAQLQEIDANYQAVDSIIQYSLENFSFKNDSALYIDYNLLWANQLKISNDFEAAQRLLYKVLAYAQRNKYTPLIIQTKIKLGELYRASGIYHLGIEHLNDAKSLVKQLTTNKIDTFLAQIANRKAAIYQQSHEHPDSVEYLSLKVIQLAKKIDHDFLLASSANELGYFYLHQGHPEAEKYLLIAMRIWEKVGHHTYAINSRLNLCRYLITKEKYLEGIQLLEEKMEEVENSEWLWEKGDFFRMLGGLYNVIGEHQKAYQFSRKAMEHLLEVNEKQYNERLAFLTAKLEMDSKIQEMTQRQKAYKLTQLELITEKEVKRNLYIILSAALLIILIVLISYIKNNKQQRKLKSQQKEISKTNETLNKTLAEKDTLLREVNHRVKNNLSVLSSMLYLQQRQLQNKEAVEALKSSQVRISTIALIHESFYQMEDMQEINFQQYIPKLIEFIRVVYWPRDKNIKLNLNCHGLSLPLNKAIPMAMVLNELITNSFKYAWTDETDPSISILYSRDKRELSYEDNGTKQDKGKKVDSLGSKLIKLFCKQLEASVELDQTTAFYKYRIHLNF